MISIIGNGACALFTAVRLVQKGYIGDQITIFGPSHRRNAASTNAGAMTNVFAEIPYGTFENKPLKYRFDLVKPSLAAWDEFCTEFSALGFDITHKPGTYIFTNSSTTRSERLTYDYIVNYCSSNSIGAAVDNIPDFINPLPDSDIQSIYYLPDGRFEPAVVIAALELFLHDNGVHFIDNEVTNIKPPSIFSTGKFLVSLANGDSHSADKVLIANGSFAQDLIDKIPALRSSQPRLLFGSGCYLKLKKADWLSRYPGLGRTLDQYDSVFRTVDRGGACGLHVVYRPVEDVFYVGASSAISVSPQSDPTYNSSTVLIDNIVSQLNLEFYYYTMQVCGNGHRPVSADTYPLLGCTAIDNLYIYNGMKRDGFTSAPHISKLMADLILDGSSDLPDIFKPSRSKISYISRDYAVDSTVSMYKAADYQHRMRFAPYRLQSTYDSLRSDILSVYKKRRLDSSFGIHPELFHLYQNDEFFEAIV